jgi:hypothetical protein
VRQLQPHRQQFFVVVPQGRMPAATDTRTELARFITPFSDYQRGALATYVFADSDVASYASTLADASQDVWIGIRGGSNPYDGDPCTSTNQTADFSGGDEYMNTMDTLSVNGQMIGTFSTKIDCAAYAKASPDGNPGIFQSNNGGNPRNWCPGALVAARTCPVMLNAGMNNVSLGIAPSKLPSGSYYATSISFSTP